MKRSERTRSRREHRAGAGHVSGLSAAKACTSVKETLIFIRSEIGNRRRER